MNITKGEWKIEESGLSSAPFDINSSDDSELIARCSDEANAVLIAEAGSIANQTGLSPKQLLGQRDELLEALKLIVSNEDIKAQFGNYFQLTKANQAIEKVTK